MLNLRNVLGEDRDVCVMTTNDSTQSPKKTGEPEMVKPSIAWMLVPILLIALAIFLAR